MRNKKTMFITNFFYPFLLFSLSLSFSFLNQWTTSINLKENKEKVYKHKQTRNSTKKDEKKEQNNFTRTQARGGEK